MPQYAPFSSAPKFSATFTVDPGSLTTGAFGVQNVTISGINTDMIPVVNCPSLTTGYVLIGAQITAENTLTLTFYNSTGGTVNPAAQSANIVCL